MQPRPLQGPGKGRLHADAVAPLLHLLGGKRLHDAHAADRFLGVRARASHGVLHRPARAPDAPPDGDRGPDDERNQDQGQQTQPRAREHEQRDAADQGDGLRGGLRE